MSQQDRFYILPCTAETGAWASALLDLVLPLQGRPWDEADVVTPEEAALLGNPCLHVDLLSLKKGVIQEWTGCTYRFRDTPEDGCSLHLFSNHEGVPEFAVTVLSLLTGKFPEAYPEPLTLDGKAQVYKGYIDTPELDPEFKEGIEAVLAADRLAAREEKLPRAAPQAHMKLQTKLNELLAQHSEMIFNHILGLPVVDQLEMLIAQGGYTEQQLQDLLFPPTSKPN